MAAKSDIVDIVQGFLETASISAIRKYFCGEVSTRRSHQEQHDVADVLHLFLPVAGSRAALSCIDLDQLKELKRARNQHNGYSESGSVYHYSTANKINTTFKSRNVEYSLSR